MSVRLTIKLDVALNRVLDVFEGFVHICSLRMTTRQLRTTDRDTFVVGQQGNMKFSLHAPRTYPAGGGQSMTGHLRGIHD